MAEERVQVLRTKKMLDSAAKVGLGRPSGKEYWQYSENWKSRYLTEAGYDYLRPRIREEEAHHLEFKKAKYGFVTGLVAGLAALLGAATGAILAAKEFIK